MNKLNSSSLFHILLFFWLDLVNKLNLVNKKGLTTTFTKSSLGCTYIWLYAWRWKKWNIYLSKCHSPNNIFFAESIYLIQQHILHIFCGFMNIIKKLPFLKVCTNQVVYVFCLCKIIIYSSIIIKEQVDKYLI